MTEEQLKLILAKCDECRIPSPRVMELSDEMVCAFDHYKDVRIVWYSDDGFNGVGCA